MFKIKKLDKAPMEAPKDLVFFDTTFDVHLQPYNEHYEITCPYCKKTFCYRDPREDGLIECLFCNIEIEIDQ